MTLDTGSADSFIDRGFLSLLCPDAQIKHSWRPDPTPGAGGRKIVSESTRVELVIPAILGRQPILARCVQHVHVVDQYSALMLLGDEFVKDQGLIIDIVASTVTMTKCQNATVVLV